MSVIWERGTKHELNELELKALQALANGYPFIHLRHRAVLRSFGLSYNDPRIHGEVITEEGVNCLAVWGEGYEYDFASPDRIHRHAAGGKGVPARLARGPVLRPG